MDTIYACPAVSDNSSGRIPILRTAASHFSSSETEKMISSEAGVVSQAFCMSSDSNWSGAQPAHPRQIRKCSGSGPGGNGFHDIKRIAHGQGLGYGVTSLPVKGCPVQDKNLSHMHRPSDMYRDIRGLREIIQAEFFENILC